LCTTNIQTKALTWRNLMIVHSPNLTFAESKLL